MAGMPAKAAVFVDGSPVFEPQEGFTGTVLARYQDQRIAAAFRLSDRRKTISTERPRRSTCRSATAHVVLIGFRPEWRGQPFGARVLFNARALLRDDSHDHRHTRASIEHGNRRAVRSRIGTGRTKRQRSVQPPSNSASTSARVAAARTR